MIGPTASTQVAIRALSLGRFAIAASRDAEAPAFACRYAMLFISDWSRYCRVCSFGVSIYREHVSQSFQYAIATNNPIDARDGLERGRTMVKNVLNSLDPSILADSISDFGIVLKKFFRISTLVDEAILIRISTQIVFFRCSVLVNSI